MDMYAQMKVVQKQKLKGGVFFQAWCVSALKVCMPQTAGWSVMRCHSKQYDATQSHHLSRWENRSWRTVIYTVPKEIIHIPPLRSFAGKVGYMELLHRRPPKGQLPSLPPPFAHITSPYITLGE